MVIPADLILCAVGGLILGFFGGWLAARSRARHDVALAEAGAEARARLELAAAVEERTRLDATLKAERQAHAERLAAYQDAEQRLERAFQALSAASLDANARRFLDLASAQFDALRGAAQHDLAERQQSIQAVLDPMRSALDKVEQSLAAVESARQQERGQLATRLTSLAEGQKGLEAETRRLVQALRAPQVRGRWGEIQLRRVVELAGMEEHCDFEVQQTYSAESAVLRPDLIVTLPGGRSVVVDAKAPLMAYLEAVEAAEPEVREARLRDHASQVRAHVTKLGGKGYWEHVPSRPTSSCCSCRARRSSAPRCSTTRGCSSTGSNGVCSWRGP